MRPRELRARLIWLTAAVLILGAATFLLSPRLASALDQTGVSATPAVEALLRRRLLRASYALDMLFLLACGFLFRETARSRLILDRRNILWVARTARLAGALSIALMAVGVIGNLLRFLSINGEPLAPWLRLASAVEWLLTGAVAWLLAVLWWKPAARTPRHRLAQIASILLAAGGLANWAMIYPLLMGSDPLEGRVSPAVTLVLGLAFLIQIGLWKGFAIGSRLLYLVRVPLAGILLLAVFGPLALGPCWAYLGGLFDVSPWQLFVIAMAAFLAAFGCVAQVALVLLYGAGRANDITLRRLHSLTVLTLVRRSATAAALLFAACTLPDAGVASAALTLRVLCVAGGYVAAVSLVLFAEWVRARISPGRTRPPALILNLDRWPFIGRGLVNAQEKSPPQFLIALSRNLRVSAGRGYWNDSGVLHPGHGFALSCAVLSLAFYVATVALPWGGLERPRVPTLAAIALLVLAASWFLSGLAFLLDPYRVPLASAAFLVWFGVSHAIHNTDHVFRLGEGGNGRYALRSPAAVLAAYEDPIAIAAAGGGIQAAAWTARALQGLDAVWGDLSNQVAVLSTVSGGSVGALYFGAFLDGSPRQAFDQASRSSFDQVAWGFLGPDAFRPLLLPRWRYLDRGFALENAFRSRMGSRRDDTLRDWANRAGARFPAFLFNTTVAETGQLIAFATTQFPSPEYRRNILMGRPAPFPAVESWVKVFGLTEDDVTVANFGLSVATAARLSATLPHVIPAARPWWEQAQHAPAGARVRNFHLIDGGSSDNHGLVALTQWLDDALEHVPARPPRIRVVIIRGATASGLRLADTWTVRQPAGSPSNFGLGEDVPPLGGLERLRFLAGKWSARGVHIDPVLVEYPDFAASRPECAEPPLAWRLTPEEKQCIEDAWLEGREPRASSASMKKPGPR